MERGLGGHKLPGGYCTAKGNGQGAEKAWRCKDNEKQLHFSYICISRAPPGIKSKFMEELQDVLDKVPSSDLLLLLGDFNARVGCSDTNGELWRGIRGRYGIGAGNEAGDRLLEFCAVNQLTVMNTWFAKKDIHLATWQHPATRQQYMIDYVLMRAGQHTACTDV